MKPGSQIQFSHRLQFHVPWSLFPVPCSLFSVLCSLFPVPRSLFPVPCSYAGCPIQALLGWDSTNLNLQLLIHRNPGVPRPPDVFVFVARVGATFSSSTDSISQFLFPDLCSLFSVLCSLFSVLCSLFSVLCSLFSVLCSLFSVLCSLFSVPCSLFPGL
jgi:hypothetical protein